jgi:hypothetical protein
LFKILFRRVVVFEDIIIKKAVLFGEIIITSVVSEDK